MPFNIRNFIVPIVEFCSEFVTPIFIIGIIISFFKLMAISRFFFRFAILLFIACIFFQFITLPVEFNASKRAIKILQDSGYLNSYEIKPVKKC